MDQIDKLKITSEYKRKVIEHVDAQVGTGRNIRDVLKVIRVPASSYYKWKKEMPSTVEAIGSLCKKTRNDMELLPQEKEMVLQVYDNNPHLRHRQIQGMIQLQGHYISPSSVYKILKENGRVEDYERRPSPLKVPLYEIHRKNILWCEDWTKIVIGWTKWHFLALIDAFSRLIVAWEIVPQVSSADIERIYQKGLKDQGLEKSKILPTVRSDRGSPNTSLYTREFFKDLGAIISFASVRRPTENALIERFFGTLKQEESYLAVSYPDERTAKESIGEYIRYYNSERPHQSLWNFTPQQCHDLNNKSQLLVHLKELKGKSRELRKEMWGAMADNQFIQENFNLIRSYNECVMQQSF